MAEINSEAPAVARRPPLLVIVLLIAVVALAIYIGTNVLGVMYAVIAPPMPPIPPDMTQISYENQAYGVDLWKYASTGDACALVQYVENNGGACLIAPMQCGEYRADHGDFSLENSIVARCTGKVDFSIFHMQWWELITRPSDTQQQIEAHREVYWIGTGPQ